MDKKRSLLIIFLLFIAAAFGIKALFFDEQKSSGKIIFEDVSLTSGISYQGMTFGGSWGDFNGDGLPDLYLPNHHNPGMLYLNVGDGRFKDVTKHYFESEQLTGDEHGAAWADYDNDGDQDLIVLYGGGRGVGTGPNHFYVNTGDRFQEQAQLLNISNPPARARMPLWFDFDRDGYLDLFLGALERSDGQAPAGVYLQRNQTFTQADNVVSFATGSVPFCIISELTGDGQAELVCRVKGASGQTAHAFNTSRLPMKDLKLLPASHFNDIVAGDFDGDMLQDLYLARAALGAPVIVENVSANEIVANIKVGSNLAGETIGFRFHSEGDLTFHISPEYPPGLLSPADIYVGSAASHPDGMLFDVSSESAEIDAVELLGTSAKAQISVGLQSSHQWVVQLAVPSKLVSKVFGKEPQIAIKVSSTDLIGDIEVIGGGLDSSPPDRLLINHQNAMQKEGADRGLDDLVTDSVNVVTGDFDNDMDLDVYVVTSGVVANKENILLINQGNGEFEVASHAGGARGGRKGIGNSAVIADYNQDGFLDILVANGGSMGRSWGLPSKEGGYRLYRNRGNNNHWLEIDLEGTKSNRDGIGAQVIVTAGGRPQVRIQDGGMHNQGQNHQRLHFGLGNFEKVDTIVINWPSGIVQHVTDVDVDQIMTIKEH